MAEHLSPIRAGDDAQHLKPGFINPGMPSDGNLAAAPQSPEKDSFRGYSRVRGRVVQALEPAARLVIRFAGFDAERSLSNGRAKLLHG